jgi:hypothetical protein
MPQQPPQYQTSNIADTNSSPNNVTTSDAQTQKETESLPSSVGGILVLNWDWNDLVTCSFCNVSISVRVLSPGDDGDVMQTNAVISTSLASTIDSLQQAVAQQTAAAVPVALSQPIAVAPIPVAPASLLLIPGAISASVTPPAPTQELEAPPAGALETAAPSDDVTDDASAAPAVAPPLPAEVAPLVAADTTSIPQAKGSGAPRERSHGAVAAKVQTKRASIFMPTVAPARSLAPAVEAHAAPPSLEPAATPSHGWRHTPGRAPAPSRFPPVDGTYAGSAASVGGSGPPPDSPAGLLALLVFLVPGFAQWLWARAELRPRALRPGRPERPG